MSIKTISSKYVVIDKENLNSILLGSNTVQEALEKLDNLDSIIDSKTVYTSDVIGSIKEPTTDIRIDTESGLNLTHDGLGIANLSIDSFLKYVTDSFGNSVQINTDKTLKFLNSDSISVELDIINNSISLHLVAQLPVNYTYESDLPSVLHTVEHNMNTFNIRTNILVQDSLGNWSNDLCKVKYLNKNKLEIWLTEASNVICLVDKIV